MLDNLSKLLCLLPEKLKLAFTSIPTHQLNVISDVRIRLNKPLIVYIGNTPYFFSSSKLVNHYSTNCLVVDDKSFTEIVDKVCNNSFHSHINTMKQGFVTTKEGLRVGIASTAIYKSGELYSIKDITSLCIRLPHEYKNCSAKILSEIYEGSFKSVIIASKPSGGKTTLIRDMTKRLSEGYKGKLKKLSVIDERDEISNGFDLGINTDIIKCFDKKTGIEIATRTLSPDIIVCDEIGSIQEVETIEYGFSTGVKFIVTVHASSLSDILSRNVIKRLIATNEFANIVLLENYTDDYKIFKITEELIEDSRKCIDNSIFHLDRD